MKCCTSQSPEPASINFLIQNSHLQYEVLHITEPRAYFDGLATAAADTQGGQAGMDGQQGQQQKQQQQQYQQQGQQQQQQQQQQQGG